MGGCSRFPPPKNKKKDLENVAVYKQATPYGVKTVVPLAGARAVSAARRVGPRLCCCDSQRARMHRQRRVDFGFHLHFEVIPLTRDPGCPRRKRRLHCGAWQRLIANCGKSTKDWFGPI